MVQMEELLRMHLTCEEKDPCKIFEGEALTRRMNWYRLLDESHNNLDYVLALTVENFLEHHLQILVLKTLWPSPSNIAAVLTKQRHIRLVVNVPPFMVRVGSQKHIDFSLSSPILESKPGKVKRKNQKATAKKPADGNADEDDKN